MVVDLDSLVDNNSKISAHFEGMFCRLLSTSYARLYFLSMQSLKILQIFLCYFPFITKSIRNNFFVIFVCVLQGCSNLKISIVVIISNPLFHDCLQHGIIPFLSKLRNYPCLTIMLRCTELLDACIDIINGEQIWKCLNWIVILNQLYSVCETTFSP